MIGDLNDSDEQYTLYFDSRWLKIVKKSTIWCQNLVFLFLYRLYTFYSSFPPTKNPFNLYHSCWFILLVLFLFQFALLECHCFDVLECLIIWCQTRTFFIYHFRWRELSLWCSFIHGIVMQGLPTTLLIQVQDLVDDSPRGDCRQWCAFWDPNAASWSKTIWGCWWRSSRSRSRSSILYTLLACLRWWLQKQLAGELLRWTWVLHWKW